MKVLFAGVDRKMLITVQKKKNSKFNNLIKHLFCFPSISMFILALPWESRIIDILKKDNKLVFQGASHDEKL